MAPATRAAASRLISEGISGWLRDRPEVRNLAVFAALPGEPDLRSLHGLCPRVRLVYPLVGSGRRLSFHRVIDPDGLVEGAYRIREPEPGSHPVVRVDEIDGFLCPGLAFDDSGTRLGRGGGFYDRALEGARAGAVRAGVCFTCQTTRPLPREPHDVVMSYLATEDGVRAVRPSQERAS